MAADGTAGLQMILADGVMELKMHPISAVEVQRRIRVAKCEDPTTRPASTLTCSKRVGSKSPP